MFTFDPKINAFGYDCSQTNEQVEIEKGEDHPIDESSWQVDNYPY